MPYVANIYDTVETATSYARFRALAPPSAWYGSFESLRMYDEKCPANEGGVCRQPLYDQGEQIFLHAGDAALMTGEPTVGVQSASTGCTWNWNVDYRGAQGGYILYESTGGAFANIFSGSGTTFVQTGLTNATTYYVYVDSILVSDTTDNAADGAVTVTGTPVSVAMAGVDANILAHTRLHFAAPNAEDVEVLPNPAPRTSSGHTVFSAIFTSTHLRNLAVTDEAAFSGTDPLDTTQTMMANTTQPSYGTRLPANLTGDPNLPWSGGGPELANCKPLSVAPSTPLLANPVYVQAPVPYPTGSASPPANATPIVFNGSVDEVASAAAMTAPQVMIWNNSDGSGGTLVTSTPSWATASCGPSCTRWTISGSGLTSPYKFNSINGAFGPIDERYTTGTTPACDGADYQCTNWGNYAKNNRVANPTYATNDSAMRSSCSYDAAERFLDLLNDFVVVNLDNPAQANNSIYTEEILKDELSKNFDINNNTDLYIPPAAFFAACTQANYGPIVYGWASAPLNAKPGTIPVTTFNSTWKVAWNDGEWINFGHNPPGNNLLCSIGNACAYNFSPTTQQRFFDSSFGGSNADGMPTESEWEDVVATVLEDANQTVPIQDILANATSSNPGAEYWTHANSLLVEQWPNGAGSANVIPIEGTYFTSMSSHWFELYDVQFRQLGVPQTPLVSYAIPSGGSTPPKLVSNPCVPTAIYNCTNNLFERLYSNGIVLVCPNAPLIGCKQWRNGASTVYLVNPDADNIENGAGPSSYTAIPPTQCWPGPTCSINASSNTAAIIEYSKQ
jgi:hypothetical protein